jgi:hypothetical protein
METVLEGSIVKSYKKAISKALKASEADKLPKKALREEAATLACLEDSMSKKDKKRYFKQCLAELVEENSVIVHGNGEDEDIIERVSSKKRKIIEESKSEDKISKPKLEVTVAKVTPVQEKPTQVGYTIDANGVKSYPPPVPKTGNNTILLFYAYCNPQMTRAGQDNAISHCTAVLNKNGISGRLRVGREGFNATLTGSHDGIRAFTADLRVCIYRYIYIYMIAVNMTHKNYLILLSSYI